MATIKTRDVGFDGVDREIRGDIAAIQTAASVLTARVKEAEDEITAIFGMQMKYAKAGTITFEQETAVALELTGAQIPAGAIVVGCLADVTAEFDGSASLTVGTADSAAKFMASTDITEATVGVYPKIPSCFKAAENTSVYATLTHTTATKGSATIYFLYI